MSPHKHRDSKDVTIVYIHAATPPHRFGLILHQRENKAGRQKSSVQVVISVIRSVIRPDI